MSKLPHEMETPAQRLQKYLKGLFDKFVKTPYAIPAGIAIATGVYALVLLYANTFCLGGLIAPLVLLGIMWQFGVKGVKKLLIIGAVSCLVFAGVTVWYSVDYYQHVEQRVATSTETVVSNNQTVSLMVDGTVDPLFGTSSTVYNFTVSFNLPDNGTSTIKDVNLVIESVALPSVSNNYTMLQAPSENNKIALYYYNNTVSNPVSRFIFYANVSDSWKLSPSWKVNYSWIVATDHRDGAEYLLFGPVYKDSFAVLVPLIPLGLLQVFTSFYPIYILLLVMIWWTRRARRMRVEAYERAISDKEKETKDVRKEEAKVPSLAKAMGLEKEEGFVCSECGADVPADAKKCPKCGEKFD
jgi:ribosomal protein L40E